VLLPNFMVDMDWEIWEKFPEQLNLIFHTYNNSGRCKQLNDPAHQNERQLR